MSDENKERWTIGGQPGTQQQPQATPASGRAISLDDLFQPTAVAGRGGVAVTKVKEIFEQIAGEFEAKVGVGHKVYVTIADEAPLRIPAIVLYTVTNYGIFLYPLILEECGERLESKTVNGNNGRGIIIDMPTSKYYVGTMDTICRQRVLNDAVARGLIKTNDLKSVNNTTLNYVVIKRSVNLESKEMLTAFFDSAISAFTARVAVSAKLPTSRLVSGMLSNSQIQLVARHKVTPGVTEKDVFGNLMTQDFKVELLARPANRQDEDIHKANREVIISSVSGYVDFAYHNPSPVQMQQAAQQRAANGAYNVNTIPAYDPYIVLTSATPLGASTILGDNLLTQCFALASCAGIAQSQRWTAIFTRSGLDGNKKAPIGAFGLEHDPYYIKQDQPAVIQTSAGFEAAGNNTLTPLDVINMFCYPTMLVALDVEDGGPMAWVQNIFRTAKPGSGEEDLIIKELDSFSDGAFSKIWDRKQSIIAYPSTPIHLGYYTTEAGERRDLRTIDYLAMLNNCKGDMNIMIPFAEGFQPGKDSAEVIHNKREVIKMAAPNVVFTGMATRIFFNTAFISALEQTFITLGLKIILEGINDINSVIGRSSAFEGGFNAGLVNHGAFYQNYGVQNAGIQINNGFNGMATWR